jgi:hypothetical protein
MTCGAAALSLAAAPAALAAEGSISVAASSPASDVGQLQLDFTSTTPISTFTAHILTSHGTDVLDLPAADFSETVTTATGSTWVLTAPITMSQLALGTYDVSVDAQDSGGDSATGLNAGTLGFLIQPTVTLSASPTSLTPDDPAVTLSGNVSGLWPDGTSAPIVGQVVDINGAPGSYGSTVSDGSGNFSVQLPAAFGGTFDAAVQGATLASASSASVTVTANTEPTALAVTVSAATATYGQTVTVSGTLTYNPGSGFVPLPDVPVVVGVPGSPSLSEPVTGTGGTFSVSFTMLEPGSVSVTFNEVETISSPIPLLASAQYTAAVGMTYPTTITQFAASLSTTRRLSVQGCLDVQGIPAVDATYLDTPIVIQYATSPSGPWQRLGTVPLGDPYATVACDPTQAGVNFGGSLSVKVASAYYRAYFSGQPDQNYLASAGPAELEAKDSTEISSFKVSPTRLSRGGKLKFSGTLRQDSAGWVAYANQPVLVIYRRPGSKVWYVAAVATTNSAGAIRITIKDKFTATWTVLYEGNATHFECVGRHVKVTVH